MPHPMLKGRSRDDYRILVRHCVMMPGYMARRDRITSLKLLGWLQIPIATLGYNTACYLPFSSESATEAHFTWFGTTLLE